MARPSPRRWASATAARIAAASATAALLLATGGSTAGAYTVVGATFLPDHGAPDALIVVEGLPLAADCPVVKVWLAPGPTPSPPITTSTNKRLVALDGAVRVRPIGAGGAGDTRPGTTFEFRVPAIRPGTYATYAECRGGSVFGGFGPGATTFTVEAAPPRTDTEPGTAVAPGSSPNPSTLTAGAAAAGCPARPWTIHDILSVPSLWGERTWPPAPARRVACFRSASIRFTARGGLLTAVFPGVEIAPAFGRAIQLADSTSRGDAFLNAWVPLGIRVGAADLKALDMTSPGLGPDSWVEVWWSVTGHFGDPAAAQCRPDSGSSTVDGAPLVMTPAQAVELCRSEFVIDALTWLRVPPTDTLAMDASPASRGTLLAVIGVVALLVFGVVFSRANRRRRSV
jgi:hypothetical protein